MSDDEYANDLGWHALNYRTAGIQHAQAMWLELEACVDRKVAAAVAAERERCAKLCDMVWCMSTGHQAKDCAAAIRAQP